MHGVLAYVLNSLFDVCHAYGVAVLQHAVTCAHLLASAWAYIA